DTLILWGGLCLVPIFCRVFLCKCCAKVSFTPFVPEQRSPIPSRPVTFPGHPAEQTVNAAGAPSHPPGRSRPASGSHAEKIRASHHEDVCPSVRSEPFRAFPCAATCP